MIAVAAPAAAQEAAQIGQNQAWGTYSYVKDKAKVCYVLTVPVPGSAKPANLNHGDVFFFVSQKPGQNVVYEPQFIAGYALKEGSKVEVTIGTQTFSMFARGNSAWLENIAQEPQLIAAMRGGADMKVAATSGRGNATGYVFSLRGVSAALNSIATCK
jgi:hypothetical protein